MRRRVLAMVMCVSLAALVAAAMAQPPAPGGSQSKTAGNPAEKSDMKSDMRLEYRVVEPGANVNPFDAGDAGTDVPVVISAHPTQAVSELVEKWKQAQNKSDRDKVQQALHTALKEQFQARLDAHEKEIERLEAEVKRLRDQLELRRKKQEEIVEFRLQQLLREAQGLGWGTEHVSRTGPNPPAVSDYNFTIGNRMPMTPGTQPRYNPESRLGTQPLSNDSSGGGSSPMPRP